ncbi:Cyclic phosphodiesterase [Linum perenne]
MEAAAGDDDKKKNFYSVWAVPPDDVKDRLNKLMDGLRSEYGGPVSQPHITLVGAISLTEQEAISKFRSASQGVKAYTATVDCVSPRNHCLYLLLHSTAEAEEASSHCSGHFGYKRSIPYMPHLSLLYGDLTEEEKAAAQEKTVQLHDSINSLSFPISRLELWKTDTEDKSLKSWVKISDYSLTTN